MKKCKVGYYYCYTDKKCKKIPVGYRRGLGGYLRKETEEEKKNDQTKDVLKRQLEVIKNIEFNDSLVVAYEPVWAIGTGNTPTPDKINEIHKFIKDVVQSFSDNSVIPMVLYGGSVNQENAENFFKEESVDGALIGGASLDGRQFANIINIFNGINLK